jgi:OmpA-OmpF porin, OOP family
MKIMIKSALFLAAALIALPAASASADTTPGWYTGLGAGMSFQENTGSDTANVPEFKFAKPGYNVLGDVGYEWDNGIHLEGEAFHDRSVVKNGDGALSNTDLFANAIYDLNLGSIITPYAGAGIGVDFSDADNIGPIPIGSTGVRTHVDGSDTKFAWQAIAGLAAQLDSNWALTADYRYIVSVDPKYTEDSGPFPNSPHARLHFGDASQNIVFGVKYSFDTPAPVPVKATTPPSVRATSMAKPVVAPVPQTFEVFFDFNKSDLTPEAKRIIASAAEEYKGGKFVRIVVTGHTDTMGTAKYNKGLSEHRAAAVKAEFASLGVDANVVVAKGVGKTGLLVPTNDQVREAQNRRAEIVLDKK